MFSEEKEMETDHLACSKDIQNLETKVDARHLASVRHPVQTCYVTVYSRCIQRHSIEHIVMVFLEV